MPAEYGRSICTTDNFTRSDEACRADSRALAMTRLVPGGIDVTLAEPLLAQPTQNEDLVPARLSGTLGEETEASVGRVWDECGTRESGARRVRERPQTGVSAGQGPNNLCARGDLNPHALSDTGT